MIRFCCDNKEGTIDENGFVRWSNVGFHLQDVVFEKESKLVKVLRKVLEGTRFEVYTKPYTVVRSDIKFNIY